MDYIVYLQPQSGFLSPLRSDTLWNAICWGIHDVFGQERLESFIDSYQGAHVPELLISSVFPYSEDSDNQRVPYFPLPRLPLPKDPENLSLSEFKLHKKLKGIKWVHKYLFETIVNGEYSPAQLKAFLRKQVLEKTYSSPKLEQVSITHNTIDRLRGGTLSKSPSLDAEPDDFVGQLFHVEELFVLPANKGSNAGWYFLARTEDREFLESVMRYLSDTGIGGDRHIGKGNFVPDVQPFSLRQPKWEDSDAFTTLSLLNPTEEELLLMKADEYNGKRNYQDVHREGIVGLGGGIVFKKDVTTLFSEGSVLPNLMKTSSVYGQTVIVKEPTEDGLLPHNVYRYGHGFVMPMILKSTL